MRLLYGVIRILLVVLLVVSAIRVGMYAADYLQARRASKGLREAYHAEEAIPAGTPQEVFVPAETPVQTIAEDTPSAAPASPAPEVLESIYYPDNPMAKVSSRFQKIRRQNKDIVGWLTIDELVDEAVVHRDNQYYLDHDYRGYRNVNGAIFLDEACDLNTRPYTLMLFGHNMKNGLMFGGLRNYENIGFYRRNPLITFDTAYENGRYVIFSVATVNLNPHSRNYVDFFGLTGQEVSRRRSAIRALKNCSLYTAAIDVEAEDQILLLITCVDDDNERRVIAARRVRPDEDEEWIRRYVQEVRKK